ncbi:complex I subunit 1 family protein [Mycolicibacterium pyrenivorans]|uniref:complex I subunit 1 family protein n=1 Tax=Mycolicibacterium pyrenivorans TaxID=187102 RepID=UPI0021F257CB|nr:complex I subunit 1 family protein [Mycolicibacterium pyrenivorans]MCV7154497.1 NADH-quinone oxidoreductase subunit H [Mycolicibacterium pyrenivorans]
MTGATVVSAAWAPVAAALLLLLAYYAAALDRGRVSAPVAETARLMRQRRRVTIEADRPLWRLGGGGLLVAALLMITVVPLGQWVLFDLDVGVVWFNAMDVLVWALVWLAGWGPNSTHSLIGGYRFLAQGLGYELPLMFALVAPAIAAQSLHVGTVAAAQQDLWFVVWMPVAFAVYCLGVTGFSVWGPLSAAVGDDIAGGVAAELSGVDRLLFEVGRYALLAAGAAFAVPLFLGGGAGPLLPGWLWVLVKTVVLLTIFVWFRSRLPVLRPDKFMEVGWMVLLPLVLAQDLVVAVIAVWRG